MRLLTLCSVTALVASTATLSFSEVLPTAMQEAVPTAKAVIRASADLAGQAMHRFDVAWLKPVSDAASMFQTDDSEASDDDDEADAERADFVDPADTKQFSPEAMCDALVAAAAQHGLPPAFFARLIWQESRFNPQAVSRAGAQGVAQFMPSTAAERGIDPLDPAQALPASAQFLSELRNQFGGNLGLAAAAYNAGARRIQKWVTKRGKLPKETRHYVSIITGVAPERWVSRKPLQLAFETPARAPCKGLDETPLEMTTHLPPKLAEAAAKANAKPRNSAIRAAAHARGKKQVAGRSAKSTRVAAKKSKERVASRKSHNVRVARAD